MSYTEVSDFLRAGPTFTGDGFFNAKLGYGGKTWITESAIYKRVEFRHGSTWLFVFDRVTEQVRVFLDGECGIVDGRIVVMSGFEFGPAEWN